MAFRYLLLFLLPVAFVWVIGHATSPFREELHLQARDLLNRALSENAVVSGEIYRSNTLGDFSVASSRLDWFFRGCIFLGVVTASLLIPRRAEVRTKANLLTIILAGFGIAKLLGGLPQTSWPELAGVLLAGLTASLMIIWAGQQHPGAD